MANNKIIVGEEPFQVLSHSFTVSPSESGYTLQYSADGISYTDYEKATPAGEVLIVNGVARGQYIRLKGNTSNVSVMF